jgi:hypothetical protein
MSPMSTRSRQRARSRSTSRAIWSGPLDGPTAAGGGGVSDRSSWVSERTSSRVRAEQRKAATPATVKRWLLGQPIPRRTRSMSRPPAAAPTFWARYQRLKPALRERSVV